jgi:hypothetical protein
VGGVNLGWASCGCGSCGWDLCGRSALCGWVHVATAHAGGIHEGVGLHTGGVHTASVVRVELALVSSRGRVLCCGHDVEDVHVNGWIHAVASSGWSPCGRGSYGWPS